MAYVPPRSRQMTELWDGVVEQIDVAALLVSAEAALTEAYDAALLATSAKLSPFTEGASDTLLMTALRRIRRDLHDLRTVPAPRPRVDVRKAVESEAST